MRECREDDEVCEVPIESSHDKEITTHDKHATKSANLRRCDKSGGVYGEKKKADWRQCERLDD